KFASVHSHSKRYLALLLLLLWLELAGIFFIHSNIISQMPYQFAGLICSIWAAFVWLICINGRRDNYENNENYKCTCRFHAASICAQREVGSNIAGFLNFPATNLSAIIVRTPLFLNKTPASTNPGASTKNSAKPCKPARHANGIIGWLQGAWLTPA
ncbi:MAG: hypothetical protein L6Q40_01075, partial [Azonexus sp.]|nr:hypothetical protein [Azonexus sp.]